MRCRAVAIGSAAALIAFQAGAQTPSVVQSTCQALNEDPERLAAFEARALAELALRNPSVRRVLVTCDETRAEVSVEPEAGPARSRALPVTLDRQHLVDDLLAAVWDLAPEPRPEPPPPPPPPLPPKPPAPEGPRDADRWFVLGRFGGEIWSGAIRGLWGPDLGGGWSHRSWSVSLHVALRRPVETPQSLALSELGGGVGACARFLGPLEAGIGLQLWRVSAEAGSKASPSQQVGWSGTASFTLRLRLELDPLVVALGPQLVLRAPRVAVAIDEREVAELPWVAGGGALELRFFP